MKNFVKFLSIVLCLFFAQQVFADSPVDWQIDFQEAASPIMRELKWFHDLLMIIITAIVVIVALLLLYVAIKFNAKSNPVPAKFTHNVAIEIIWTLVPILVIAAIAVPSFKILRLAEHTPPSDMTIKVVGNQWYWTYSYPDNGIEFDSNMIQDADLKPGQLRLLEVDNRIVIPVGATVKFLITASDVLHSFAIPSLGLKTDAGPGRTNEAWTRVDKEGVYYGQCSELCGANHGFMPIALEVVSKEKYEAWLLMAKEKYAMLYNNKQYALK
jgi:cytochrome c oxidase subunit 2